MRLCNQYNFFFLWRIAFQPVFRIKSRKVTKIEYDKTGLMNGDKAKEVMRILGLKNYSTIQLKTRTGTSLSFTKTETKYF